MASSSASWETVRAFPLAMRVGASPEGERPLTDDLGGPRTGSVGPGQRPYAGTRQAVRDLRRAWDRSPWALIVFAAPVKRTVARIESPSNKEPTICALPRGQTVHSPSYA